MMFFTKMGFSHLVCCVSIMDGLTVVDDRIGIAACLEELAHFLCY